MIQPTVFVIEVRTEYLNDPGTLVEIWWAAVPDEGEAIAKVREASGSSSDTEVLVLGKLNPAATAAERLKSGDVRSAL